MISIGAWIWIGLFFIGILLFTCYHRTGHFFRCLSFTALTGLTGLGALWIVGRFIALPFTITPLTIGVSSLLGIPGLVGMLLMNLL